MHEAFIDEYMMPNLTAYNETCANICNAMFSYRMLGLKGESKYADVMELVLYNSAMSGISIDGTHYFYTNPLRRTLDYVLDKTDQIARDPYIPCFCCPPNLVRTIAKSSGWAYSLSENGIAVNLYGSNQLNTQLLDGSTLRLTQETQYPWKGAVKITVEESRAAAFDLLIRIPGWAKGSSLQVNGQNVESGVIPGHYAKINRQWKAGDVVQLDMPMQVSLIEGHPRIEEVRNQVAIKRGPVVYCIESPDLPEGVSILDVYFPQSAELVVNHRPSFLGGLSTLKTEVRIRAGQQSGLYGTLEQPDWKRVEATLIPYYAWANRGPSEMTVWMPILWDR